MIGKSVLGGASRLGKLNRYCWRGSIRSHADSYFFKTWKNGTPAARPLQNSVDLSAYEIARRSALGLDGCLQWIRNHDKVIQSLFQEFIQLHTPYHFQCSPRKMVGQDQQHH
jgi:hypothetical protein